MQTVIAKCGNVCALERKCGKMQGICDPSVKRNVCPDPVRKPSDSWHRGAERFEPEGGAGAS